MRALGKQASFARAPAEFFPGVAKAVATMDTRMSTQNAARTIVLIHGLFLTWSSWEKWVERYSARGFNVIAPGWPGLEGSVQELRHDSPPLTKLDIKSL